MKAIYVELQTKLLNLQEQNSRIGQYSTQPSCSLLGTIPASPNVAEKKFRSDLLSF